MILIGEVVADDVPPTISTHSMVEIVLSSFDLSPNMVVYSFYIFDRHGTYALLNVSSTTELTPEVADCIYKKRWPPRPSSTGSKASGILGAAPQPKALSAEDDAKLIFGTVFSLRNMIRKLGGQEDK